MEKSTDSAVLIKQEADYDSLPMLSFWRNSREVLGGLGWLQASSSFWESLEDVSVFSVRVLPAHLWRELQYLVFTSLN